MKRAVVLGSNGPAHLGQLRYATSDAARVAAALGSHRCGFDISNLSAAHDVHEVRRGIFDIAARCSAADDLLVYFAGHGVLFSGELYLVWHGTTPQIFDSALPTADVMRALKNTAARNTLLVLDCCHAGGAIGARAGPVQASEVLTDRGSSLILMASERLELVREIDTFEGSFLSHAFARGLSDDFIAVDDDGDGRMGVHDLLRWMVEEHSRAGLREKGVSTPFLFGEHRRNFALTSDISEWTPHTIQTVTEDEFVILPARPSMLAPGRVAHDEPHWRPAFRTHPRFQSGPDAPAVAIGKHPVTNAEYQRFVRETGHPAPVGEIWNGTRWVPGFRPWEDEAFGSPGQPVVCVDWLDGVRYAQWLSRKECESANPLRFDLPTSRLWDFVLANSLFPNWDPSGWMSKPGLHHRSKAPADVHREGAFSVKCGAIDVIGNVWEWVGSSDVTIDPLASGMMGEWGHKPPDLRSDSFLVEWASKLAKGVKGGGYIDNLGDVEPRLALGQIPTRHRTKHSDLGIRLAAYVPQSRLPDRVRVQLSLAPDVYWQKSADEAARVLGEGDEF